MSAAELLMDLGRQGIRLEADGERLRFHPRSALTPDLLDRLKAHKGELLTLLRRASDFDVDNATNAEPVPIIEGATVCRCGSTTWRDVPIHDGQSIRRDCGQALRRTSWPIIEGTEHFSLWVDDADGPWPEFIPGYHYDIRQPSQLRPLVARKDGFSIR